MRANQQQVQTGGTLSTARGVSVLNLRMRSFAALVFFFTVLAAALLWGQTLRSQAQLREQVLMQSEQRSLHLAGAMAGQMEGLFGLLDVALTELRYHWTTDSPPRFDAMARETLATLPEGLVSHVTVVNAKGRVIYNSLGDGIGTFVGDRDYFRIMQEGGDQMVVSPPIKGRISGVWHLVAGRPILQDGEFLGTVHLLVSTEYLARKLAALELSPQDIVGLVHPNGRFVARSLNNEEAMGQQVPPDRPFLNQAAQRSGVFRQAGALDAVARTFGWHRLPDLGVVVVIGLADSSVLDPLAPVMRFSQQLTGVFSLLLLAGGGWIAFLIWRVSRSREQASESEHRLQEAQRMARVGNWLLDHASGRVEWSDEIFRILGLDRHKDAPSYARFMALVHPEDRDRVKKAFSEAQRLRQLFNVAHRIQLPDGRIKHLRQLAVTEFDGERPVRSKGTVQDITEARTAQLALQQLNDELETHVSERTRELGAVNRELEAFAYSVSHDLRTPLRSIHGFASLLAEESEALSVEGRAHLRRIQEAARRMGVLITDLLSMAHHGRAPVRHETVNLSDLARAIASELERGDPQRQVQWDIEDGLAVRADPLLMRVVLQNLLGNAWKYTGQTADARVSFSRTRQADGQQEFCVRDNGAGFDMAYVGQLFQPFKRLHNHHDFEGSGVGLATVLRVVQRHGGRVYGEGRVGEGASFFFSLPDEPVMLDLTAR